MKTIIEPFKIKSVEPVKFTTVKDREDVLKKEHPEFLKLVEITVQKVQTLHIIQISFKMDQIYQVHVQFTIIKDQIYRVHVRLTKLKDQIYRVHVQFTIIKDQIYRVHVQLTKLKDQIYWVHV